MSKMIERREFTQLIGLGGVVFASGLAGVACGHPGAPAAGPERPGAGAREDFFFLQLSDTHWGYTGAANPNASITLRETIATINASPLKPDFIVFTGDLTHTTDDAQVRKQRLAQFREIAAGLTVTNVRFLPGEHDASLDQGAAYKAQFGESFYAFDHKGIHFVALDNVSDPHGSLGDLQLKWLTDNLAPYDLATPIVVFAHRPLFDLYPAWEWATADGAKAIAILQRYPNVTVFYGHIHQEHHMMTGAIAHHAAKSLIFPLPAPGSVPKKAPIPWDAAHPYQGLGYRSLAAKVTGCVLVEEHPVKAT